MNIIKDRFKIILILVITGLTACKTKVDNEVSIIRNYYNNNCFDSVLIYSNKIIKEDTSNILDLRYLQALSHIELKNYKVAQNILNWLYQKKYSKDSLYIAFSDCFLGEDNYYLAICYIDSAIYLDNANDFLYYRKSIILYNSVNHSNISNKGKDRKLKDALNCLQISNSLKKDYKKDLLKGAILYSLNDFSSSESVLNSVIKKSIDSNIISNAYRFKALIYKDNKRLNEAKYLLDSSIYYDPKNEYSYAIRGGIYSDLQLKDSACMDFRKAQALGYMEIVELIKEVCNK